MGWNFSVFSVDKKFKWILMNVILGGSSTSSSDIEDVL